MFYEVDSVSLMTLLACSSDTTYVHTCGLGLHIFVLRKIVLQNLEKGCIYAIFSSLMADAYGDNDNTNNNKAIYIYTETSTTKHLTNYTQESIHQM